MYCAIIGDLVDSKKIPPAEQDAVQRNLKHLLSEINTRFSAHISANFLITLGDEFQGLLNESAYCLSIVEQLIKDMYPIKIRFGIGIGDVNTEIDPENAIGADGPAYHFARKAISELKAIEHSSKNSASVNSPFFHVRFETDKTDTITLNLNCDFINNIMSKWSEKQWKTVRALIENDYQQNNTASSLGLAKSTVSRNLQAARYGEYQAAINKLNAYLIDTYDKTVTANVQFKQEKTPSLPINNLPERNPRFSGRKEELEKIKAAFERSGQFPSVEGCPQGRGGSSSCCIPKRRGGLLEANNNRVGWHR